MMCISDFIYPTTHIIQHLFRYRFLYVYIIQRIACAAMLKKMI